MLAGKAEHDDIVDVTVVEGAVRRSHAVITANRAHIEKIAAATGKKILIENT